MAAMPSASGGAASDSVSPIYGVSIPEGYRQWELVAPAQEGDPLDELRAVLGNPTAMAAYQAGRLPFLDGTILVKLAWKHRQSSEFPPAFVPGAPTTVQVMVKDSRRYAATGAGASAALSTESRWTKRNIRHASPATLPMSGTTTSSLRGSRLRCCGSVAKFAAR
jgi:Cytochrome P460